MITLVAFIFALTTVYALVVPQLRRGKPAWPGDSHLGVIDVRHSRCGLSSCCCVSPMKSRFIRKGRRFKGLPFVFPVVNSARKS